MASLNECFVKSPPASRRLMAKKPMRSHLKTIGVRFWIFPQEGSGPKGGDRFAELGVRPDKDFLTPLGPAKMVNPGNGGLSVFLGTPMNIPPNFRPSILGGQGKYPLWGINSAFFLPHGLMSNPHGSKEHSFIEPMAPMTLDAYQKALADTRDEWLMLTR